MQQGTALCTGTASRHLWVLLRWWPLSLLTGRTSITVSCQASPPHFGQSRWMLGDLLQRTRRFVFVGGGSEEVMSEVRDKPAWDTSSPLYWAVSQVPFPSSVLPSPAQSRHGFEEGTARTSPGAAFPLRPCFLFEFVSLCFPDFGSCYSTGLNNSSQP